MTGKKYKLTKEKKQIGSLTLFRIEATASFGIVSKASTLIPRGFVQDDVKCIQSKSGFTRALVEMNEK
jgi:hypothetical protein